MKQRKRTEIFKRADFSPIADGGGGHNNGRRVHVYRVPVPSYPIPSNSTQPNPTVTDREKPLTMALMQV